MKNIVSILLIEILILAIVYFSFAFVLAELNPFKWSMDARFFMMFMVLGGIGLSVPIIGETIQDKSANINTK